MQKISIKREQSQAGLSFAEREKFRPQVKNRLLLLLALLMTAATGAWAQTQTWDSGACTVTLSDGVMTVSGTGPMEDYYDSYELPWYGKYIKTIVIESGVSSIGNSAFAKCYNLESVSIPASVTSIGNFAFEDCGSDVEALTVSFAEGSTPLTIGENAFNYAKLKSIDIPKRMTSIGNSAFSGCNFLESVSIPASVTSIGQAAFQRCGSYAEALTVSFAEGSTLESIGEYAFIESTLKSIDIPNSVTSIGGRAFENCTRLESVSIPASVTSIGVSAFSSCYMLAKVNIFATSLTTYGTDAFDDNADGRKIYVLPEAVDTYKAGWPDYAADIEAMTLTLYATSVKEGTEDADKWTISPTEAAEGSPVTATYSGEKKVKSVKAVKKAAPAPSVPDGAINGKFSVSATKQVYFSKGNLRYASDTWSFFDNQYDYYESYSADARDKFGWSTAANTYGMNTSTDNSTYSGDFVDWGATMGTGWRTLSIAEWDYLFNTRTVNNGTGSGKSYTLGKSVGGVLGVVLYPDDYTGAEYSGSDWASFESAGCVFLPAAGRRKSSTVGNAGSDGYYWSSSPDADDADYARNVYFSSDFLGSSFNDRYRGLSVRLVRVAE